MWIYGNENGREIEILGEKSQSSKIGMISEYIDDDDVILIQLSLLEASQIWLGSDSHSVSVMLLFSVYQDYATSFLEFVDISYKWLKNGQ